MENLKLLFQMYFRPASAMSDLMDRGDWLVAAVIVLVVSGVFFMTVNAKLEEAYRVPSINEYYRAQSVGSDDEAVAATEYRKAAEAYQTALANRSKIPLVDEYFLRFFSFEPSGFYRPILSLSIFYVPFSILLICVFTGANFGLALRRDYGTLAVCTLTAWAAAHLPFAVAGILLYSTGVASNLYLGFWILSGLLFGVFMIFALRVSLGASYGSAILTVCIAWLSMSLGMYAFKYISPWLFSPFLLFYGYMYFGGSLRGEARGIGNAFRQRQNFKRFLQNATVNPRDADAHLQLGLIYLQRHQEAKAIEHFNRAVEIDKDEIDANYELGKIARAKGDLQKALNHFSIVVEQNDKHSLSEIWREIGATYLAAEMFDEAREPLETFVERRAFDPEGLYYLGKVLKAQGETEKAREIFESAVEAAKTSPDYRRRDIKSWVRLAQKEI